MYIATNTLQSSLPLLNIIKLSPPLLNKHRQGFFIKCRLGCEGITVLWLKYRAEACEYFNIDVFVTNTFELLF